MCFDTHITDIEGLRAGDKIHWLSSTGGYKLTSGKHRITTCQRMKDKLLPGTALIASGGGPIHARVPIHAHPQFS